MGTKKVKTKIESFQLDHTKVIAPYIRLISRRKGQKGDEIANFDIRLTQPNEQFLDPSSSHTIEHCAAGILRDILPGEIILIDSSPYGCLTGFHNITWVNGEYSDEELVDIMIEAWTQSLEALLTFEEKDVPGISEKECGNAALHSLYGAKIWAGRVLNRGFSTDPFTRKASL